MTNIDGFGTIRLEIELTMRLTLAEPGAKSFFKIFLVFSHIRLLAIDDLPYWLPT